MDFNQDMSDVERIEYMKNYVNSSNMPEKRKQKFYELIEKEETEINLAKINQDYVFGLNRFYD